MLDTSAPHVSTTRTEPVLQRSHGLARIAFGRVDGTTRLRGLRQEGSARLMLPRTFRAIPEAVLLNTSGGLTSGDRMVLDITLDPETRATVTSQTAERAYTAGEGPAQVTIRACVGAGARLNWLPQETILYQHADLQRATEIALLGDASCLICETIILGRHAMGETTSQARLWDRRRVTRDGHAVWHEPQCLGPVLSGSGGGAMLPGGMRGLAVVALIAPGAEDAVDAVRRVLDRAEVRAAASGWDGRCIVRMLAHDGWPLRRQVMRVLETLGAAPLPRVWQM